MRVFIQLDGSLEDCFCLGILAILNVGPSQHLERSVERFRVARSIERKCTTKRLFSIGGAVGASIEHPQLKMCGSSRRAGGTRGCDGYHKRLLQLSLGLWKLMGCIFMQESRIGKRKHLVLPTESERESLFLGKELFCLLELSRVHRFHATRSDRHHLALEIIRIALF